MYRLGVFGETLDGFSGIPRSLIAALELIDWLDVVAVQPERYAPPLAKRIWKRLERSYGREYLWEKSRARCRYLSARLDGAVADHRLDAILVIGSEACAYAQTSRPIFGFGDSIFGSRLDFYDDQSSCRVSRSSLSEGVEVQQLALDRLETMFVTSTWAWRRAVEKIPYRVAADKFRVTGIGANVPADVEALPFPTGPGMNFVWLGGDWVRKRGEFAVEVVSALRGMGIEATLTIVGAVPRRPMPPFASVLGPIGIRDPARGQVLASIFGPAAALLLPSKADLTPIAISEAGAFGRPTVAADVGAIGEMIRHEETGLVLATEDPAGWAAAIARYSDSFARFGECARQDYVARFNWKSVAEVVADEIRSRLRADSDEPR